MRRLFIIGVVALLMGACGTISEEVKGIQNPTGKDIGGGGNTHEDTTFRGAKLPDMEMGGSEMKELIALIDKQQGDIDDELFEEMLTEKLFKCKNRFMKDDDNTWTWAFMWDGGVILGTIMPTKDGIYYDTYEPGCGYVGDSGHEYMQKEGYKGWYTTYEWSYDADTHTLKTTTDYDFKLEAEVLYFDGNKAVLVGHVGGTAWVGCRGNDSTLRLAFEEELYLFEFADGRDKYLEGFLPKEEYDAMIDNYLNS